MSAHLPVSMRRAGRDLLSLALIDSRNATLRWLAAFERELVGSALTVAPSPEVDPPLWLAFGAGWFQEYWIARNMQRSRGEACDPTHPRLASIAPRGDAWMRSHDDRSLRQPHAERWQVDLPSPAGVRQYLVDTLETTLDLLTSAEESDAGLYFYRLALHHEDAQSEAFARIAQTLGLAVERDADAAPAASAAGTGAPATGWRPMPNPASSTGGASAGRRLGASAMAGAQPLAAAVSRMPAGALLRPIVTLAPREPLLFPATRHRQGVEPGGFAFDNERPVHEVAIPEFEIDAQPVNWQQFAEFVEDGGYDDERWWTPEGWAWVQTGSGSAAPSEASGPRRSPRHVEQMRRGVLQRRFDRVARVPAAQPVLHASWYEADAWCRWAGRRLPAEVEWEHAAVAGASRGFRHGDVWEWTASTLRSYPGYVAGPWRGGDDPAQAAFGRHKVLRGASFATRSAFCDARFRHWAAPARDDLFSGFRSCAL